MALCSLFSNVHDPDPNQLPRRLSQLSRDGNRAYGLLPLDLGEPTKDIVGSDSYILDPVAAALRRWKAKDRGIGDRNGSNAPLVRIHPIAAGKQSFPSCPTLQTNVSCPAESIKRVLRKLGADTEPEQSPLNIALIGLSRMQIITAESLMWTRVAPSLS